MKCCRLLKVKPLSHCSRTTHCTKQKDLIPLGQAMIRFPRTENASAVKMVPWVISLSCSYLKSIWMIQENLSLLVFSLLSSHSPNPFYTHCPFTLNPPKQFSSRQVLSKDHIRNSNYVIKLQRSTNISLNFWLFYTCSLIPEENMPAGT